MGLLFFSFLLELLHGLIWKLWIFYPLQMVWGCSVVVRSCREKVARLISIHWITACFNWWCKAFTQDNGLNNSNLLQLRQCLSPLLPWLCMMYMPHILFQNPLAKIVCFTLMVQGFLWIHDKCGSNNYLFFSVDDDGDCSITWTFHLIEISRFQDPGNIFLINSRGV